MPYTEEDGGRLNNFAATPKMYKAEPPNKREQVNYIIMGALSLLLVSGLLAVAVWVSGGAS